MTTSTLRSPVAQLNVNEVSQITEFLEIFSTPNAVDDWEIPQGNRGNRLVHRWQKCLITSSSPLIQYRCEINRSPQQGIFPGDY